MVEQSNPTRSPVLGYLHHPECVRVENIYVRIFNDVRWFQKYKTLSKRHLLYYVLERPLLFGSLINANTQAFVVVITQPRSQGFLRLFS